MKSIIKILRYSSLFLFILLTASCFHETEQKDSAAPEVSDLSQQGMQQGAETAPTTLPVRYQTPSYMVDVESKEDLEASQEDFTLKVGASIRSTRGPQPLWDILKRLAALKGMNVSWASDVDQKVLVDVDINAGDDFYQAIDNLLRQVDYYHTMQGNTIVVNYKETRQYHIALPHIKSTYETGTGGNVLGSNEASSNVDGTIRLDSKGNEFNIWENIQENLDAILNTWSTVATDGDAKAPAEGAEPEATETASADGTTSAAATRQVSASGNLYTIDRHVGLITVHAPRPLHQKLESYINNLKRLLFKQVSIEAKVIEVQLQDNSTIGINWDNVLKNFSVTGAVEFGSSGQIWPYIYANEDGTDGTYDDGTNHGRIYDPTRFVSKVSINTANFGVFLNALREQGDARILSNPKLTVMNGQPSLITVGRNVTYIDSIESDLDSDTGIISFTVNTERILSGLGMAITATIMDNNEIVMNLVPVTSELEEPIEYRDIGTLGGTVGLPIVNVREMSTTVRVKNGEMLVIGGLISNVDETEGNFAPGLGSIPLIRYLFGYEKKTVTKRELIILLKPVII